MVYVDNMEARFNMMKMCHMIADSKYELLEMANKIGVNRKWIQKENTNFEHFDICLSKKKLAIECGAIEITRKQLGEKCIYRKDNGSTLP